MSKLGSSLKTARERKGLTLRSVQDATGISNPYLSQIESGKVRQPSPTVLHKLAGLYGLSYAEVMKLAGFPVPDNLAGSVAVNPLARLGPVSAEEEEELGLYLNFLRERRRRGAP
jgi:transcriptional regulator with XRE-family HTH domain